MQVLTLRQIVEGVEGTLICGDPNMEITAVSTDSRKVGKGVLFVPLAGERFDGHDFIEKALAEGAGAALTHRDIPPAEGKAVVKVKDTFDALGKLARYYKEQYPIPTVAVVGSVGKTTTKDMIAGVVSRKYNTLKTQGNFNNEIGMPLTVFQIEKEHEAAVLEMGMSGFGEIEKLAAIGRPDVAVMTNIGVSHIEKLGSRENIFKAKMEVTKLFTEKNLLIANGDDEFLSKTRGMGSYRVLYYGIENPENDIRAKDIQDMGLSGIAFTICCDGGEYPARVRVAGVHNVYNALAAFAVGRYFDIEPEEIIKGIEAFELTKMRMAVEKIGDITVINDCYNAAPDSVKASLRVLGAAQQRRVACLGDVLELGDFSQDAHRQMGQAVAESGINVLIAAGQNSRYTVQAARENGVESYWFDTTAECADFVKNFLKPCDTVLIKASRGMHFEAVYDMIKEKYKGE